MITRILLPAAGLAALLLTACGQSQPAPASTDATAPAAAAPEAAASAASPPAEAGSQSAGADDPIRGKGGIEERCLAEVAKQGTTVIGTNRIAESDTRIEVFVNVKGGAAPWLCRATRDGTIETVEYTQTEGAL